MLELELELVPELVSVSRLRLELVSELWLVLELELVPSQAQACRLPGRLRLVGCLPWAHYSQVCGWLAPGDLCRGSCRGRRLDDHTVGLVGLNSHHADDQIHDSHLTEAHPGRGSALHTG